MVSTGAGGVTVLSLDAEGTLASHEFSRHIWQVAVPALYGQRHGLSHDEAAARVFAEYASIGPGRPEWYDIGYWFHRLQLGEPAEVIESHRSLIEFYPETGQVLQELAQRYTLVVASSTPLEFLRPMLRDIEHCFAHMFSSTSSCGRLKDAAFFRWMCNQMGVTSAEVVHVGDHMERDYLSARQAGMKAFYLDRTGQTPAALRNLTELVQCLDAGGHGVPGEAMEST